VTWCLKLMVMKITMVFYMICCLHHSGSKLIKWVVSNMIHIPHCGLQYFRHFLKFGVVNCECYFYRFLGFCSSKEFIAHIVKLRKERLVAESSK
jgi:hypothetical protein